jgi:hypothetical protein
MTLAPASLRIPEKEIDIIEQGCRPKKGRAALRLDRDLSFSTTSLESYAFARWEPVIFDAMVVAAAIEYGDRIVRRPPRGWARRISIRVPVHDPDRWRAREVSEALKDTIEFLTGDYWSISFVKRRGKVPSPPQHYLNLLVPTKAVLPYSDGMDSRAVAGIVGASLGAGLVRVRVGSKSWDRPKNGNGHEPFTTVPYDVPCNMPNRDATSRSRGFKFALISSIAAYLTDAEEVIVPESGQGAIGPALITVGHAYPDYRNHPLFTKRMERFVRALLNKEIRYVFPRIWNTKGETLHEYVAVSGDNDWASTRSCWQNNRWSSVNGKLRQCGVCAACMLRRVSVHAAGLIESADSYICTDMAAETLEAAVDPNFTRFTPAFREYAIARVLHMDHLADMALEDARPAVRRHALLLGSALGIPTREAEERLIDLLQRHAKEWKSYMDSLGAQSFVKHWARCKQ